MRNLFSNSLFGNVLWLVVSLVLAFFVWVIAMFQQDPISEARFGQRVPVQIQLDDGMLLVNTPTDSALVTLRAQQSVLDTLAMDDITVRADLRGLPPGEHVVELRADVARSAIVTDLAPRQIRVVLETASEQYVPVLAAVNRDVPAGYERDAPVFDVNQVLVSGASSVVARVVAAHADLDLSSDRAPAQVSVRLVPVDADGVMVSGVTLRPQNVTVTVAVRQRDDVREITVVPYFQPDTLSDGYILSSLSYNPQTILVTGTPAALADLPATFRTQPIDLTGRTASFDVSINVVLPAGVIVISGETIQVSVGITALTASRSFDDVPVSVVGLADGLRADLVPASVTVLVTGPQPIVAALMLEDVRVVVDANGLLPGSYPLTPSVTVNQPDIDTDNLVVLPAALDVTIVGSATPTDALVPTPSPDATP